jgi:hypothetical protein
MPAVTLLRYFNNVKKFGKISTIDVSNPLKVLLYYKDFSTIVVLDSLWQQEIQLICAAEHFPGKRDRPVL